mmetsp:Transcript_17000/g.20465  ORF Transcript_17000/g.20465 Transcript_17000/m.20465 type:complete len:93 (-) Transcript_17000:378-656(-)|eukprot:jgi/Bigna1/63713/fgenesh1_kg.58_\
MTSNMKKMDAKGSNNWNKAIKIVYGAIKEDEDGKITAGGKLIKDKGGFITHIGSDKVVRAKGEVIKVGSKKVVRHPNGHGWVVKFGGKTIPI